MPVNESPPRKRFTRAEFYQLLELEVFAVQRFELVNGDLIDKRGQKPAHAFAIHTLFQMLGKIAGFHRTRSQAPVELVGDYDEPDVDLSVESPAHAPCRDRHPRGCELSLAIEVSDSALPFDTVIKRDLYARSAVPEYWVLDLSGRQLIVHRKPVAGRYEEVSTLGADATVDFEGSTLEVAWMLPAI